MVRPYIKYHLMVRPYIKHRETCAASALPAVRVLAEVMTAHFRRIDVDLPTFVKVGPRPGAWMELAGSTTCCSIQCSANLPDVS